MVKQIDKKQVIIQIAIILIIFHLVNNYPTERKFYANSEVLKNCERVGYNESVCLENYKEYHWNRIWLKDCKILKKEEGDIPKENYDLLVDVYVVNLNDYTDENIEILFRETNSIWKNYGVQFHINSINWVNNDSLDFVISPDRKALKFGESVVGERLYREKDKIIDLIIVENLYSELEILNLWFKWPFPIFGGRGVSVNDTNFIPFSPFSKNASWVLVHEMGHLLGQYDMAYYMREYNLMTNDGCIKYDYFPTILNQEQVNSVTSTIKNKNFKQL